MRIDFAYPEQRVLVPRPGVLVPRPRPVLVRPVADEPVAEHCARDACHAGDERGLPAGDRGDGGVEGEDPGPPGALEEPQPCVLLEHRGHPVALPAARLEPADANAFALSGLLDAIDSSPQDVRDIEWYSADGDEMTDEDWRGRLVRELGVFLSGEGIRNRFGETEADDTFLVLLNANPDTVRFRLPNGRIGRTWRTVLDTAAARPWPSRGRTVSAGARLGVRGRSLVVLQRDD